MSVGCDNKRRVEGERRRKLGTVTRKVEAKCNQTPPRLRFLPCPENLPKPNSLAGGFLKSRLPNRPLAVSLLLHHFSKTRNLITQRTLATFTMSKFIPEAVISSFLMHPISKVIQKDPGNCVLFQSHPKSLRKT